MKAVSRLAVLATASLCVSAQAYNVGQNNSKRDVATKPVAKEVIAVPKYSPTQVLCVKQRRAGSRVTENKCQTLAKWKQEIDEKAMRQHLIKARGKAASWELSP